MASPPLKEFGQRHPAPNPATSPPVKRSRHVALLLTGTLAVGGSAYALMPRENCQSNNPGIGAPSSAETAAACTSRTSSGGGHGGWGGSWSRRSFFSSDSTSSSGPSTASGSTAATRGGFGGFARAIGAHFSGG